MHWQRNCRSHIMKMPNSVKQKEDEKLWKGLESKFSSPKTLCDQVTETLQHLAGQVHDAEKDKEFFEDKLSSSAAALDNLHNQTKTLSLRFESSEETGGNCLKQCGKSCKLRWAPSSL